MLAGTITKALAILWGACLGLHTSAGLLPNLSVLHEDVAVQTKHPAFSGGYPPQHRVARVQLTRALCQRKLL